MRKLNAKANSARTNGKRFRTTHAWTAAYTPFRCRWRYPSVCFVNTDFELHERNALASSAVVDCPSELPRITRLLPLSPLLKRQRKERVCTPLFIRAVVNSDTSFVGVTAGGA